MKKIIFTCCIFLPFIYSRAQISEGGKPLSLQYENVLTKNIPVELIPSFNLDSVQKEDEINAQRKDIPWRFGYNFSVNFNPDNSGIWENCGKGNRIWRLKIASKNAVSINIIFGEYFLPEGGKVFIYNENKTQILGAFTEKNNLPHRKLGVDLIKGDAVIVEYFEPYKVAGKGILMIEQVTHGYRGTPDFTKDFGDAGSCNNNVVCPEGAPWQNEIRASAMNLVNGNSWCSGALINNTCQDGTPYYLTANHCVQGQNVTTWLFRFNYESPTCSPSGDGPYNFTVSGSTLRAKNGASDFALLELSSAPPASYNVFYAGWDRSGNNPQKQVGIHHPSGDVKKISFDDEPAIDTLKNGIQVWQITSWNDGTTEGGSSGSPLFDENHRIIGQLWGGSASCSSLTDDNYGRFNVSWDFGGTPSTELKDWLDMCNTAEVFIDGLDPNMSNLNYDAETNFIGGISSIYCGNNLDSIVPFAVIKNNGTDTLTKLTVLFGLDGITDSLIWTGSLASNQSDTVYFSSFIPNSGDHIFSVTSKNPNDSLDQKIINDSKSVSFKFVLNSYTVLFTLKTDDYGSETSWQVKDSSAMVWYAGGGYNDVNGGQTISDSMCVAPGCYDFIISDDYGDGMSGSNGNGTQGTYYFQNENGDTIASIIQVNFGTQEINNFCLNDTFSSGINFSVISSITCFGNCNGSLHAIPNSGNSPYTYQWSSIAANQTNQTATGLCAGIYSVTVSDSLGNNSISSYNLSQPMQINLTFSSDSVEQGSCTGTASVFISGGTPPYSYLWSNSETVSSIDSLCAGNYLITITDSSGCQKADSAVISEIVGINDFQNTDMKFQIYPNPNSGVFSLSIQKSIPDLVGDKIQNIKIYNILGKEIHHQIIKSANQLIDISMQPSGIYIYKITSGEKMKYGKLIKEF